MRNHRPVAVSAKYPSAEGFRAKALEPFARRFSHAAPFRPVNARGCYADAFRARAVRPPDRV
jgi:hypothetical protein